MQTSSKSLTKEQTAALYHQLSSLIADLDSPDKVRDFLNGFLTETEQIVFAKRLAILWLLHTGHSYEEIKKKLMVSSATISTVSEIRKKPGIQLALEKMQIDKWAEAWSNRILKMFQF